MGYVHPLTYPHPWTYPSPSGYTPPPGHTPNPYAPLDIPLLLVTPGGYHCNHNQPPPPNRMTDTCENITFPQPHWRSVKMTSLADPNQMLTDVVAIPMENTLSLSSRHFFIQFSIKIAKKLILYWQQHPFGNGPLE